MKKINYILTGIISLYFFTACDLTTVPTTAVDAGSVFNTTIDAEKVINGSWRYLMETL